MKKNIVLITVVLLLCFVSLGFAQTFFFDDFENETVGSIPSQWHNGPWSDAGTNYTTNTVSHYGQKSLHAYSYRGGQKGVYAPSSLHQGDQVVKFAAYLPSGGVSGYYFGGIDYSGIHIFFKSSGDGVAEIFYWSGSQGSINVQTVYTETWNEISVDMDWQRQQLSIIVNGRISGPYSFTPSTTGGWGSDFSVRGDNNGGPRTIYIDDVSIENTVQTQITVPAAPVLTHTTSGLHLSASWRPVSGATGYTLFYAPYPYTGPESIGSIDMGSDLNFSMYLWNGAAYYIAAAAYNEQGSSGYSNIEHFILEQTSSDPIDVDNDGITENQGDCNDHDSSIYPGATDICGDGIDQDCSGSDAVCGPSSITLSGVSWSLSGKYSYCSSSATGSAQFTTSDSLLTRYSYSGQDWHEDCSVSSFPYVDVSISSLGLTDPVSRTEVDTLCTAMMEMEAGPYFDVTVTEFTSTRFKCSYYDRRDGSVEIVNFSR